MLKALSDDCDVWRSAVPALPASGEEVTSVVLSGAMIGRRFVFTLALVVMAGRATAETFGPDISVYATNHKKKKIDEESTAQYAKRLENVAGKLLAKDATAGISWDLIGLCEGYFNMDSSILGAAHHDRAPIPCPPTGSQIFTPACFDTLLSGGQLQNFSYQAGDAGVVARSSRFELIGDPVNEKIGMTAPRTLRYRVVGGRFKIIGTPFILPFFSVHIAVADTPSAVRRSQLNDLLRVVDEEWREGDLTPVIVGDFNMRSGSALYPIMASRYSEVGKSLNNRNGIEHIWVGSEASFCQNGGSLRTIAYQDYPDFNDDAVKFTDHPVVWARFALPTKAPPHYSCTCHYRCCQSLPSGECAPGMCRDRNRACPRPR